MTERGGGGETSLDEIRERLRALGYLHGPLQWWMASGGVSRLGWLCRASLKAALVSGPLLGIPAAITVAFANRPHFSSPRDLLVLVVLFSAVLGGLVGLLEFATEALLAWLATRGLVLIGRVERTAGRMGMLFGGTASLYLALLARSGRMAAPVAWPASLVAIAWGSAAVIALTVGRAVYRMTRAASMVSILSAGKKSGAFPVSPAALPRREAWGSRVIGLAALFAVLLVIILLPWGTGETDSPDPHPKAQSRSRILVIGVDGLDEALYERLKSVGAVPAIERLEARASRIRLRPMAEGNPPAVWTTLATGVPVSRHGIRGYEAAHLVGTGISLPADQASVPPVLSPALLFPVLRGGRGPVSSGIRRARSIWEILEDGGIRTAVINWWATWPVLAASGIQVSDRAFAHMQAGRGADRDIWPPDLQASLSLRFSEDLARAHHDVSPRVPDGTNERVSQAALIDGWHAGVARAILSDSGIGLGMVYLPGLDIARGTSGDDGQDSERLAMIVQTVDDFVGQAMATERERGGEEVLILVAESGRLRHPAGQRTVPGFILISGVGSRPGAASQEAEAIDLVPTLLSIAGLPVARDLPGKSLIGEYFPSAESSGRSRSPIDSYGTRIIPEFVEDPDPLDQEMLDRLRSLGYIQ